MEDKIQWLADNIDRILLVLTNLVTIGVAIYNWYKKIRMIEVAKSVIRGSQCDPQIRASIREQAALSKTLPEVERLIAEESNRRR